MRFLRVSVVALMILTLVGGAALADTAPADEAASTIESSTDSGTEAATDSSTESSADSSTETPSEPEVTEPAPDSDVEEEVYEDPTVEDLVYGEFKGTISAITPAEGETPATVTVMIDGEPVTFTAEQLGLTPEAMALISVGAEFKLENSEEGDFELKITGESGTIKLERDAEGNLEMKIETEHPGKGKEISEEKKAQAEEHKEAAREKAEEAKQNGKGGDEDQGSDKGKGNDKEKGGDKEKGRR